MRKTEDLTDVLEKRERRQKNRKWTEENLCTKIRKREREGGKERERKRREKEGERKRERERERKRGEMKGKRVESEGKEMKLKVQPEKEEKLVFLTEKRKENKKLRQKVVHSLLD